MKVLLTGGGTGGHITPLLTVADELKSKSAGTHITYVGERGGKFSHFTDKHPSIDALYTVFSGKFRRYHRQSWLIRLFDIKTNLLNMRDSVFVLIGIIQAWLLLGRLKPDVVFLKGAYVGVPVGLAAAIRGIPFITHDSDAAGGLANRLVSKWAAASATALPAKYYKYDPKKVIQVGVIVAESYQNTDKHKQDAHKKSLGISYDEQFLLITGGSLGAARLNKAVSSFIGQLLDDYPKLRVVHQVGKNKIGTHTHINHARLQLLEFLPNMHVYTGAADLVVTRAGANTLAELGVQGKACVVVPNPDLTGGHQLINARILETQAAALVVLENSLPDGLSKAIRQLLDEPGLRANLSRKFNKVTQADAAAKVADLLSEKARK